jgi:hypothetical protein
LGEREDVGF